MVIRSEQLCSLVLGSTEMDKKDGPQERDEKGNLMLLSERWRESIQWCKMISNGYNTATRYKKSASSVERWWSCLVSFDTSCIASWCWCLVMWWDMRLLLEEEMTPLFLSFFGFADVCIHAATDCWSVSFSSLFSFFWHCVFKHDLWWWFCDVYKKISSSGFPPKEHRNEQKDAERRKMRFSFCYFLPSSFFHVMLRSFFAVDMNRAFFRK